MRGLFVFALVIASTFAASIPPQIDSNVMEISSTPVSDAFDTIFNQARSAVVGLYSLLTIPFSILAHSQETMSNDVRSGDPLQGVFQATNHALQRATNTISNVLTNNAQEPNSDPLLRIFQQVVGKRAQMVEAVNETASNTMRSFPLLQRLFMVNDRTNNK